MKCFRRLVQLSMLLAAGTLLLGCEADRSVSAPDGLQPQFAKGGRGGGFTPIPITFGLTGGFETTESVFPYDPNVQSTYITNETEDLLEISGAGTGVRISRTTHFDATYAAYGYPGYDFSECASKRGQNKQNPLAQEEKAELIEWLKDVTRTGQFNAAIDLSSPGAPSAVNSMTTRPYEDGLPDNQQVDIGTFPLLPFTPVTVTRTGDDEYTFSGGVVQMWDRSVTPTRTLQCPNHDTVVLTIVRPS